MRLPLPTLPPSALPVVPFTPPPPQNVANTTLDLRVPVYVAAAAFTWPDRQDQIVVATGVLHVNESYQKESGPRNLFLIFCTKKIQSVVFEFRSNRFFSSCVPCDHFNDKIISLLESTVSAPR